LALHLSANDSCGQIVGASVSATRDVAAARTFEHAIDSTGTPPRRVITDKAATYPATLAVVVPGVLHRTGRYRTNVIERDHGFLKERLRPMRGIKSGFSASHLFVRSRADAEHRPLVLPCGRIRSAAAGEGFDLEPARCIGVSLSDELD
jgi:transposase-like protein